MAFALLGLAASTAATYVHYNLIKNPDYRSFCDINATVSCKAAYLEPLRLDRRACRSPSAASCSSASVLLLVWGSRAARAGSRTARPSYIFAGSTLALAVVLYLAYASFFILKEVCPLCVATYVAVIGVFVISGGASSVPMSSLPRRAVRDIRVLVDHAGRARHRAALRRRRASGRRVLPDATDGRQAARPAPPPP